ncbi:hypothetical protein BU23DRAFT_379921, partial [Bimuria novae-zelandiae CBS 107.79]
VRSYESFCRLRQLTAWLSSRQSLGTWVVQRAFGGNLEGQGQVSGDTIQKYLSALRSVHVDRGEAVEVFDDHHLRRLVQGARNFFPARTWEQRLPITKDILHGILRPDACQSEHPVDTVNLNAAFSMAFAGFLRMGEFTYTPEQLRNERRLVAEKPTRRCVAISQSLDHYRLLLPRSKADTSNADVQLVIASSQDDCCPVTHLLNLYRQDPQPANAPLFRLHEKPFSRQNLPPAQTAHDNGLSEDHIKALGRWTSEAFKRYYLADPRHLFALQQQFVSGRPPPLS